MRALALLIAGAVAFAPPRTHAGPRRAPARAPAAARLRVTRDREEDVVADSAVGVVITRDEVDAAVDADAVGLLAAVSDDELLAEMSRRGLAGGGGSGALPGARELFEGELFSQAHAPLDDEATRAWDALDAEEREGFDWEMEKARRALEAVPPWLGGPSFWRENVIEPAPESIYAEYSGTTMPGAKPGGIDTFRILLNNILQFLLGNDSQDGAKVASWDVQGAFSRAGPKEFLSAVASGDLQRLVGGPLFLLLQKYYLEDGPIYKLAFGPRSFLVISDPVASKHVLRTNAAGYDKGMLAEILAPIMGQGLIPADPDVWRKRRRVLVPGFHRRWLERMTGLFSECSVGLLAELDAAAATAASADARAQWPPAPDVATWRRWRREGAAGAARLAAEHGVVDMEEKFCSVSLDIIGRAVFNYDFESARAESPVVKAVYRLLKEAEHRTTALLPYWDLPYADRIFPSQVEFKRDIGLLNDKLDMLIADAMATREEADLEDLEAREADDASLLRFLVDMRGEEANDKQLRDDLMTMLIAGHETTAALLTWTLYELFHPSGRAGAHLSAVREEVDRVVGDRDRLGYDDVVALERTRACLTEGLRMYPEPPLLIRRALDDDALPCGIPGGEGITGTTTPRRGR